MKKYILLFFLGFVVLWAGSCKKSGTPDYGTPTITRVAQPLNTTSIDSGSFTQWVIIYGTHLASTQSVSFNDQVVANSNHGFYASDSSVTVQIPRAIPQNETNTITIVTKGGTVTYKFTVLIPDLQLTDMLNEYTAPGDTLRLLGHNFDLYGLDTSATTVLFAGGGSANVVAGTADTLKVIVPADAQPGPVTIKGIAPLNISVTSVAWYWDNRNFLFDLSNFTGWNGPAYLSSGPDPAPVNGPYFKVNKSWQGGYAWDPFCSDNASIPAELVNDPSQYVHYAVKFEMNVPVGPPSMPLPLYFCFNGAVFKELFFDVSGNNTYPFNTRGKWQTFTAPLTLFGPLDNNQLTNGIIMEFMLKDANASQSNFSICNFRMVRIN